MHFDAANLLPILPEIAVLLTAAIVLVVDLYIAERHREVIHGLTLIGLVAAVALTGAVGGGATELVFDGNVVRDSLADLLKGAILVVSLLVFIYARPWLRDRGMLVGEFYMLGLFAVLGMLVMVAANSFITVYLGLELLALSLYALVAFDRDSSRGAEAAMKYFVLGALGSGMLLYGISMVYGATGSVEFGAVAEALASQGMENKVLVFGLVFMVIGIGFKFGAVPFHMWVPDIYEGAPTPVVLLLGSAPKIAAFGLAIRLLVDGLGSLHADWQGMLLILAVLSMGIGNLVAIAQRNIKRMLAYSTISHVGFIFLGLLAGTEQGYAAAMFYTITYAVMATGAFGILIILSRKGFDAERIEDLKGLNERDSWYAAMMALVMFSMAGVPPLVGFMAKLLVLEAVVRIGFVWLAVVAVIFSIIGAFYYLRVVRYIYFDKPEEDAPALVSSGGVRVAMSLNGLALLALGIFPASLLAVCQAVFGA
ncbi:NADH-quinone oxidoreductase subunit NuoN [Marichromatium gracile]|uniref:NADH-quinone oxidoreductase subunit NuoN n=1 Tax=Marichromatium gracile TaxID=1048 RepID=UPI001F323E13|nr:NADH-quinone oxidoreductase subunit NuoN [Marichromatium gracile]MCF1184252.1 NADH-quinone oxidoreductase subunit NuoN [Marichromatium gracile]